MNVDGGGLARPVGAEQGDGLAAVDLEGDVVECADVGVVDLDDVRKTTAASLASD
jgi:hypothetical protein